MRTMWPSELPAHVMGMVVCDFAITFNASRNWFFGNGNIAAEQTDFKLVAAKQLTHGLGFITNLEETQGGLTVPRTYYLNDTDIKCLRYMSPLDSLSKTVFFRHRDLAVSIVSVLLGGPTLNNRIEPIENVFKLFQNTGLYTKNLNSHKTTIVENIKYYFAGIRIEDLGGPRVQVDGTTIFNLLDAYSGQISYESWDTENFLMTERASLETGIKLADKMQSNDQGRLFGNGILSVLEEVGYASWRHPHMIEFANEFDFHGI